jgi:hypothetical protein
MSVFNIKSNTNKYTLQLTISDQDPALIRNVYYPEPISLDSGRVTNPD